MKYMMKAGEPIRSLSILGWAPVGTVVARATRPDDAAQQWTRHDDGLWHNSGGNSNTVRSDAFGDNGNYLVLSHPQSYVEPEFTVVETVHQFKWRFRDTSITSARRSGIDIHPVNRGLDRLGLGAEQFPLGPGVVVSNADDRNRMPNGTTMATGNPAFPGQFAVHVKRGGGWHTALGNGGMDDYSAAEILSMPGVDSTPDWWAETSGADGETLLAQFKGMAWKVGYDLKQRHSWCSTFENTMTSLGIDESCLQAIARGGFTVGSTVDPAQASGLPEGTILRRVVDGFEAYFVRLDTSTNSARTRRLFGWSNLGANLGHMADRMEVVAHPDVAKPWVTLRNRETLATVPVGTVISSSPSTTDQFIKAEDGMWAQGAQPCAAGRWTDREFYNYGVRSVPDVAIDTFYQTSEAAA